MSAGRLLFDLVLCSVYVKMSLCAGGDDDAADVLANMGWSHAAASNT